MELLGKNSQVALDEPLYRALSRGDLPAAYLISKDIKKKENPATAFNCGLCLFRLGEWEKALADLKNAEQALGNQPEYDVSERRLFLKAVAVSVNEIPTLPLDPVAPQKCGRYALIRVRWLIALCLKALGRDSEAAPVERFLFQYDIKI